MNRRSFIKLAVAAIAAPYLPTAMPVKVIEKFGPLTASEALGLWFAEGMDEAIIRALSGL